MEDNSTSEQAPTLFQHAIKFGIIMGAVGFVITILLYAIDYTYLADWKVGISVLCIFVGVIIYAGIDYRKQIGGFIPFGQAFQHGFIALAVAGLIGVAGNLLLFTVIDPELPQKLADVSIEKAAAMMESFGMSGDKLDEQMAKMKEEMPARFGPLGLLTQYLWGLIFYAIVSLISGLIVRKNKPEMM